VVRSLKESPSKVFAIKLKIPLEFNEILTSNDFPQWANVEPQ